MSSMLVSVALVLLAAAASVAAEAPNVGGPLPSLERRVAEFIEPWMARQQVPGASVAVVKDGKVLLARGFGRANVELKVPATPETVFQIQSVTKPFTATAVMLLESEGKLRLDDAVQIYVPTAPATWSGITVRHLLNHTSGLQDFINEPVVSTGKEGEIFDGG